jgi:hypothetical protein
VAVKDTGAVDENAKVLQDSNAKTEPRTVAVA